ncbi:glycosyltransferase family 1 protein [Polynucleobacter sp. IMCC 29146]|uniref:glycosyltransferase family 4 protein n=1 Tax=Polynucleobacter sp. IMCC 29146 TaxID=2780953 RepID=UPI001F3D5381|nr:glycosyltransferase family 4 protein [Polynucleobacter sp. IMCC 29146]
MKVAFGTTLLDRGLNDPKQDGIDGIGQYCQELLKQYQQISNSPSISPYSFGQRQSQCGSTLLPSYSIHVIGALSQIHSEAFFKDIDLIHSTDQFIPIANKPLLATVMDVIPLSHPQFLKSQSRYHKSFIWKKLTQRADRIVTISEYSKTEITKYLGFSENQIDVIPPGVDKRYFQRMTDAEKKRVLDLLNIKTPFFLFLGSIQPRKNLTRLLNAHAKLPRSLAREFPLIIAGKLAWDDGKTLRSIEHAISEGRAKWLNYITEDQKIALLQSATGLAFVSLYEGFGLPIIEAFASGLPVITSNYSSMPEVTSDAGIIVDPENTQQITGALLSLIEDDSLSNNLKVLGKQRSKLFSWEENAKRTLSIYQQLI